MATESHPTFLFVDTKLVRVHFSVNNIFFFFFSRRNLLHTGVSLPNSGELFIMKTVSKKRMAREKGLMYLKF